MKTIINIILCLYILVVGIILAARIVFAIVNDNDMANNGYHTLEYEVYYPNNTIKYTEHKVYSYIKSSNSGSTYLIVYTDNNEQNSIFDLLFGRMTVIQKKVHDDVVPIRIIKFEKE